MERLGNYAAVGFIPIPIQRSNTMSSFAAIASLIAASAFHSVPAPSQQPQQQARARQ